MTDTNKTSPVKFITQIESVRLANFFIRTVIVFTIRLLAGTVLAIARIVQRRRSNW